MDESSQRKNARKPCTVEGCGRLAVAKGLCDNHYRQQRQKAARLAAKEGRLCSFCGGNVPVERKGRNGAPVIFCSTLCKKRQYTSDGRAAEVNLRSYYKRRYGLSMEEVDEMRRRGCDICGTNDFDGRFEKGHIDHDHATGAVRGLLCIRCNTALGGFRDDPSILRRAAGYVESHDRAASKS